MARTTEPTGLDWRDSSHVGRTAACVHCGGRTMLRDDNGSPSHKVCAERKAVS